MKIILNQSKQINLNKENKIKLESLLKKVANVWDFEICSLNIQTNLNPFVIKITIKKLTVMIFHLMIVRYLMPQHL